MAQLSQMFSKKNWKTSFPNEDQKVELVIWLFSDKNGVEAVNGFYLYFYNDAMQIEIHQDNLVDFKVKSLVSS